MIKVGFQHSLSTFIVHLHHLLGARDDDGRTEDELCFRQVKGEATTVLLHHLKNDIVDGRVLQAFMRKVEVV